MRCPRAVDLCLSEALTHYHQVVFTTGPGAARRLGVPLFKIAQRDWAVPDIIVRGSPAWPLIFSESELWRTRLVPSIPPFLPMGRCGICSRMQ
jgi:hypothetical protein